jgi:hypothetical protein
LSGHHHAIKVNERKFTVRLGALALKTLPSPHRQKPLPFLISKAQRRQSGVEGDSKKWLAFGNGWL